jgi:hypothetical protein
VAPGQGGPLLFGGIAWQAQARCLQGALGTGQSGRPLFRRHCQEARARGRQVNFMEGFWMTPADTYRTSVLANASASALVFAADAPLLVRRPGRGPIAARAHRAPLRRVGACIAAGGRTAARCTMPHVHLRAERRHQIRAG